MKKMILTGFLACALPLAAQEVFDLKFERDVAVDGVGERPLEAYNVVIMGSGPEAYADFDGRGALVVPDDPELGFGAEDVFWLEMWVEPLDQRSVILLSKGTGANYRLAMQNGEPAFVYYSQGQWRSLATETKLEPNVWQHVAVYFNSALGEGILCVDGKIQAVVRDMVPFQSRQEMPLYIGGVPGRGGDEFIGFSGSLSGVKLARACPHPIPGDPKRGDSLFAPSPREN